MSREKKTGSECLKLEINTENVGSSFFILGVEYPLIPDKINSNTFYLYSAFLDTQRRLK